jgi:hypothetical protein
MFSTTGTEEEVKETHDQAETLFAGCRSSNDG